MALNPDNIKEVYESVRLDRYKSVHQSVRYTAAEFMEAYLNWVNFPYAREHLWDDYCDVRDGVPIGTNSRIRVEQRLSRYVN